jgi:hypothetical protein
LIRGIHTTFFIQIWIWLKYNTENGFLVLRIFSYDLFSYSLTYDDLLDGKSKHIFRIVRWNFNLECSFLSESNGIRAPDSGVRSGILKISNTFDPIQSGIEEISPRSIWSSPVSLKFPPQPIWSSTIWFNFLYEDRWLGLSLTG